MAEELVALIKDLKFDEATTALESADDGVQDALEAACAVTEPPLELVIGLLGKGAKPTADMARSAIESGKSELAKLLILNLGAHDNTLYELAMEKKDDLAAEACILSGSELSEADATKLLSEAMDAKMDAVAAQALLNAKQSAIDGKNINFNTLAEQGWGKLAVAYLNRFDEGNFNLPVDDDGNTYLHAIGKMEKATYELAVALVEAGLDLKAHNKTLSDTPLHVAAKAGNLEVCRALVDCGANPLQRNAKGRTARSQVKCPANTKDYLLDAEEDAKEGKIQQRQKLWDAKMKATQTESAYGIRVM